MVDSASGRLPHLAVIALDILAIPAMSAEIERVISSSGLLLTDRRNRLKEDVIAAAGCMKSWSSDGPGGLVSLKDIEQVQELLQDLESKEH